MINKTVKELRGIAKEMGIKGYSKLRKEHLIITIEAEQTRQERVAKMEAMKNEVREVSNELEKRYRKLGFEELAKEQFDNFVCFMLNATDVKRMEQLEDLCSRYLEKYAQRNAELDFHEQKNKEEKTFTIMLEDNEELVNGEVVQVVEDYYSEELNSGYQIIEVRAKNFYEIRKTINGELYQPISVENGVCNIWCKVDSPNEPTKKESVEFKPELTAIDTRNSKSAEIVAEVVTAETKVLDYGCGTGRNIKYIKNNTPAIVHGCDIPEQLEKEKEKHSKLMDERTIIAPASELENEAYDVVLNSHVLNVIESDEVKKIVVADIFQKLKEGGKAVIEVRTKSDVEGAKTKEKYGDGWKIKKGSSFTYQEGITKEKMISLVSSVGFKIEEHIYNSSRHIIQVVK